MPKMRFWCGLGRMLHAATQTLLAITLAFTDKVQQRGPDDGLSPRIKTGSAGQHSWRLLNEMLHRAVCALRHSSPGFGDKEYCLLSRLMVL